MGVYQFSVYLNIHAVFITG